MINEEAAVRALGEAIGYGRLMQLASQIWDKKCPGMAFSVGPLTGDKSRLWQPIETAPKDRAILVKDSEDDEVYITQWWEDVWTNQGGKGGPSGWFSGHYSDNWGDHPIMDRPKFWTELPR